MNLLFKQSCFIAFLLLLSPCLKGQDGNAKSWAIKLNVVAPIHNKLSLEVEKSLSPKVALVLRGGVIAGFFADRKLRAEGYVFKLGSKIYLGQDQSGFALRPEVLFVHHQDWVSNIRGNFGNRWERSFGGLANVSYTWEVAGPLVIEPFLGLGWVRTWEKFIIPNDVEPFETIITPWHKIQPVYRNCNGFSHFTFIGEMALSGGVLIGFRF